MEIKIRIKTPKGYAKKTGKRLKPLLMGINKQPKYFKINKDNSIITWIIKGTPRQIKKIERNVIRYDIMMSMLLNNKITKKLIYKYMDDENQEELRDMLINQTSVEIVKGDSVML